MKLKEAYSLEEKLWQTYNIKKHIKKQRHHFADKGLYSLKAMVFPVVMYRCESWTIKKAEHQKIDALMLEKTLESPFGQQGDQTSQS